MCKLKGGQTASPSPSSGLEREDPFACLAGQREETWLPDRNGAPPSPPGLAPAASRPPHSRSHGLPRQRNWRSRSFAAHSPVLDRNQRRRQAGHPVYRKPRRMNGRRACRETGGVSVASFRSTHNPLSPRESVTLGEPQQALPGIGQSWDKFSLQRHGIHRGSSDGCRLTRRRAPDRPQRRAGGGASCYGGGQGGLKCCSAHARLSHGVLSGSSSAPDQCIADIAITSKRTSPQLWRMDHERRSIRDQQKPRSAHARVNSLSRSRSRSSPEFELSFDHCPTKTILFKYCDLYRFFESQIDRSWRHDMTATAVLPLSGCYPASQHHHQRVADAQLPP